MNADVAMDRNNNFRILIIDDNPSIHLDFKKILLTERSSKKLDRLDSIIFGNEAETASLELPSFQIDYASQGKDGISQIENALNDGTPYTLAFVDIRMPPGLDGIETIKKIWALDKEIQIVICTAYSDYTWEETVGNLGVTDSLLILKKPFDSIAVRQFACALTKKWQLMQEAKAHTERLETTIKDRTDALQKTLITLEYQAKHDYLTLLPNRAFLTESIRQEIARASRANTMFSLFFIDLDRFKLINDSLSHEAGDELLKIISERLKKITRTEDTVGRLGGDEFILVAVTPSIQAPENTSLIASKILNAISSESIKIAKKDMLVTASIGISLYPTHGETVEALLSAADLAMYRAKELGGNQFQIYNNELQRNCQSRFEHESDLRRALIENEFFLEYQPQYDSQSKQVVAVEALVRWHHPQLGRILPMDFIPIAEETGLIVPLGEWVIRTACAQNKAWQEQGIPPFRVAVNIATKQFIQPNFIAMIKSILEETKLDSKYLEVEVTENVIINSLHLIETIRELKDFGVTIVLDDFGTGQSGLNYLHNLPINQIKIDKSFIHNISSNPNDEVIIQAILGMAKGLDLDVIAEGIENQSQLDYLEAQSCYRFQGYFFSKPLLPEQLEKIFKSENMNQDNKGSSAL
ncbi:Bacteriophytochrome cph2 [Legionella massiliensis]|uniref:Bacteriophytochrome cph2 n=1 Tax=Legionella massiliensis TaxID=1034943 RepID=A0A078KVY8_9GAMM|nr:GGDEF and EAL domain-containing protein [Legionella massiliensis]CDZ77161.1 Bacteriophytochrome cph2 [Legionella massiliensis]CEE12899.1 Phytochrome-like protein cph2 [Legionella massiliensis]